MKLNLICVVIICITAVLCVFIHSEYNRYDFSVTPEGGVGWKLDKKSGVLWICDWDEASLVRRKPSIRMKEYLEKLRKGDN